MKKIIFSVLIVLFVLIISAGCTGLLPSFPSSSPSYPTDTETKMTLDLYGNSASGYLDSYNYQVTATVYASPSGLTVKTKDGAVATLTPQMLSCTKGNTTLTYTKSSDEIQAKSGSDSMTINDEGGIGIISGKKTTYKKASYDWKEVEVSNSGYYSFQIRTNGFNDVENTKSTGYHKSGMRCERDKITYRVADIRLNSDIIMSISGNSVSVTETYYRGSYRYEETRTVTLTWGTFGGWDLTKTVEDNSTIDKETLHG